MKARILYLYYDIMNLYGENGNIRMMERVLKEKGAEVVIDRKTITDTEIDFTEFDFIYCGCGTELSRNACLEHLRGFESSLKTAYENGTVMLFTGNSYEMLGESLTTADGVEREGLGIFDFTVKEQGTKRYSGDVTFNCTYTGDETLIGYINKCSEVQGIKAPLFNVTSVVGTVKEGAEGLREKNFFGTQVIGPVTVKNPKFADYLADLVYKNLKN
ncbi:MAG: hypothetical protein E7563_03960 [Ruminococcaceae bacterium]|nr:hypothetical protein [Oscillospiraceae bacterium]